MVMAGVVTRRLLDGQNGAPAGAARARPRRSPDIAGRSSPGRGNGLRAARPAGSGRLGAAARRCIRFGTTDRRPRAGRRDAPPAFRRERLGRRLTMERSDRLARTFVDVADTLVADFDIVDFLTVLTFRCVELFDLAAAGLMLSDADDGLRVAASSNDRMQLLELFELQYDEGPCLDSYRSGEPVRCDDIITASASERWPTFVPEARSAGYASVYALADAAPTAGDRFAQPVGRAAAGARRRRVDGSAGVGRRRDHRHSPAPRRGRAAAACATAAVRAAEPDPGRAGEGDPLRVRARRHARRLRRAPPLRARPQRAAGRRRRRAGGAAAGCHDGDAERAAVGARGHAVRNDSISDVSRVSAPSSSTRRALIASGVPPERGGQLGEIVLTQRDRRDLRRLAQLEEHREVLAEQCVRRGLASDLAVGALGDDACHQGDVELRPEDLLGVDPAGVGDGRELGPRRHRGSFLEGGDLAAAQLRPSGELHPRETTFLTNRDDLKVGAAARPSVGVASFHGPPYRRSDPPAEEGIA